MSQYSIEGSSLMVLRYKVVINSELTLSCFKVVRLDSVHTLGVNLMVSNIVNFSVYYSRPSIVLHRSCDPREFRNNMLVGTEDFF